jgi:8-oxo-dGTP diphosphatase
MFNIRVYGIFIQGGKLLVSDEFRLGILMTKFPGGGLEYGEGPADCIRREWLEETGFEVSIRAHYYTTDFFQPSYRLAESNQVINIYYLVDTTAPVTIKSSGKKFDFPEQTDGAQSFRWLDMEALSEEEFTLPIDRVVVKKLNEDYSNGLLTSNDG